MSGLHYRLNDLCALIVDDNAHMLTLVCQILHSFGMKKVKRVSDAAEALHELKHFHPDFIITDWAMEPLDGLDFVRVVRTADDSPCPTIPIIMLTGHSDMRRVREARDVGVTEFLVKPISPKALYDRICALIERPRKFIVSPHYIGPDRRRRNEPFRGKDRRSDGQDSKELSQEEIEKLLEA